MSTENPVQRKSWLRLAQKFSCRLFRVNTGRAWVSGTGPKSCKRMADGSMLVPAARPVALGFALPDGKPLVGTSDLNGWTPVVITQEMVGCTLAVFTAVESKRSVGGRASKEQLNYIKQVRASGGIAGVASSEDEAEALVSDWLNSFRGNLL